MKIFYISNFIFIFQNFLFFYFFYFCKVILDKIWYVWKYIEPYQKNNRIYLYYTIKVAIFNFFSQLLISNCDKIEFSSTFWINNN
jgi:hypothetical protein